MIRDKKELAYYLECDRCALRCKSKKPKFFGDEIWKFERLMRKPDYQNSKSGGVLLRLWYRFRFHFLSLKLGFTIPCDVCGPGLSIAHTGPIVINGKCKIGANCRIHVGVNIGANGGSDAAPQIGDNVYLGPGAKIIGNVKIGDNSVIGANAVVVHDVEENITVGGVPAKKISINDSSKHLIKATELIKR